MKAERHEATHAEQDRVGEGKVLRLPERNRGKGGVGRRAGPDDRPARRGPSASFVPQGVVRGLCLVSRDGLPFSRRILGENLRFETAEGPIKFGEEHSKYHCFAERPHVTLS